jgi:Holliday junction resolvasome RuvABC endonuclease subunit
MSKTRCLELKDGILDGQMIAIDPTSGTINRSTGEASVAGWAYFDCGNLVNSGVIEIPTNKRKEDRFRDLLSILHTEFDETYDVLALEDIPLARRRGNFNTSQTLIQACGVYIAGLSGELVELNSHTWQAVARRIGGWTKGDESDAQYIGIAAIAFASGYSQSFSEKRKIEFLGELVDEYNSWNLQGVVDHWNLNEF